MSTVRINELARELEVKSKAILDALTEVGVTEKKTHSSSIEVDEAERVRAHILKGRGGNNNSAARHEAEARPRIDWSRVSKRGESDSREQTPGISAYGTATSGNADGGECRGCGATCASGDGEAAS